MRINKFIFGLFASILLTFSACNDKDEIIYIDQDISYRGIIIANEGAFGKQTASLDFASNGLDKFESDIYKKANPEPKDKTLGDVLQNVAFKGNNAYLVLNNSNKIAIVDRFTFKDNTTVTSNLLQPRYIAFTENQYYVTNNNFIDTRKLNIYNTADNSFVTSINFDRYAERVVEASGNIVVQTDGSKYEFNGTTYVEQPTGHTVTIVNSATNSISKTVTLPDSGVIKDLISYEGFAYAVSSGNSDSYVYKVNPKDGTYTTIDLKGYKGIKRIRIDSGNLYFLDGDNKVYSNPITSPVSEIKTLFTAPGYPNSFDIINNLIFVSNASFTEKSTSYIYSLTGNQIKSFESGIGTNGFYKN